ncbi:hypothetical protein AWZ03_007620 [Drosophila navojoa]|uniref:Uncharacterized protein n=1 Tax=Drosophila navojoa TaxID=7232 RepID=A0A484BD15_DRONA|nr:hypothetical protein AWZ03_007620 [Drosophila navojoa]
MPTLSAQSAKLHRHRHLHPGAATSWQIKWVPLALATEWLQLCDESCEDVRRQALQLRQHCICMCCNDEADADAADVVGCVQPMSRTSAEAETDEVNSDAGDDEPYYVTLSRCLAQGSELSVS